MICNNVDDGDYLEINKMAITYRDRFMILKNCSRDT